MTASAFRALPSVDRVLTALRSENVDAGDVLLVQMTREIIADARAQVAAGGEAPSLAAIVADVLVRLESERRAPLRALINATGVILHTNLGRAPLADEAIEAMAAVSRGYSNLEFDVESGKRGSRHDILEPLVCRLTGAEAAMTVNNNASAVLLTLSALAARREVVLSRGELVEIGGGFRIPDVMRQSRARLVEAGTTNRTRLADFDTAIGDRTAALMRVHASNFRIIGFTESVAIEDLAALAHRRDVLLLDDVGSGCLLDTTRYGLALEPTPQRSIAAGTDVVLFSGDKLLGGPQAGLIAGRREQIARLKRHPLARAVRLDKATIAGLAATLRLYVNGVAEERVPVWRMIAMPLDVISRRASAIAHAVGDHASVIDGRSMIGGGSLPEESLATELVALSAPRVSAARLAAALRSRDVIARVEDARVLLDPRTIEPDDDGRVAGVCRAALNERRP